jgi:hypothetical protein
MFLLKRETWVTRTAFKDTPLLDSVRSLMARRVSAYDILVWLFNLRNS